MTDRKRDPLPEGYQFGDARKSMPMPLSEYERRMDATRVTIGAMVKVRLPAEWPIKVESR